MKEEEGLGGERAKAKALSGRSLERGTILQESVVG